MLSSQCQSACLVALLIGAAAPLGLVSRAAGEPIQILNISRLRENVSLRWRGGFPPYRVQVNTALNSSWSELPDFINSNSFTAASASPAAFFQVRTEFDPLRILRLVPESEFVRLEWRGGIPPYRVEASDELTAGWQVLPRLVLDDFYVTPLTTNDTRFFRVRIEPDTNAPFAPATLALLSTECNRVVLGWDAAADAVPGSGLKAHNLYRDGQFMTQVLAPQVFAVEAGLTPGRSYAYSLSSVDRAGNESTRSHPLTVTLPQCSGTGTNGTGASPGVTLAWDASEEPGVAGYLVHWGLEPGVYPWQTDVMQATTTTVTELESGVPYFFVITAYDFAGVESEPSAKVAYILP